VQDLREVRHLQVDQRLVRAGTGRRQLKRRLSLRRRRGRSVNPARKDVKVG
jgi:hypothetical protein